MHKRPSSRVLCSSLATDVDDAIGVDEAGVDDGVNNGAGMGEGVNSGAGMDEGVDDGTDAVLN